MTPANLSSTIRYSGVHDGASWTGRAVEDRDHFASFVQEIVKPRVADKESGFEADLRGLATTDMATDQVGNLLRAVPEPQGWEVGEALAECVLQSDTGKEIHWPWNTVRDRRTPRASLPGADLVGFIRLDGSAWLLFGEVKTSSDKSNPPNVMYGGSGMTWQLEESAKRLDIQVALLRWLHARCSSELLRPMYEEAVKRFLASRGKALVIVGVLVRDTEPHEGDLQSRGKLLAERLPPPTRVDLLAWHLPIPISEWPVLLQEEAQ